MNNQEIKQLLQVGDLLSFEPAQIAGQREPYPILSIDGQLVKVSTPDGFRLLPLQLLAMCKREGRLQVNGALL